MRILLVVAAILVNSVSVSAQNPVRWTMTTPRTVILAPGAVTNVGLKAHIENGWRIYSLTQKKGGPYGMTLSLLPGSRALFTGTVTAPTPLIKFDSSFKMMAETYSGDGAFSVMLKAPTEVGTSSTTIKVRYQACSNRFCLPPKNELFQVTFIVKPGR